MYFCCVRSSAVRFMSWLVLTFSVMYEYWRALYVCTGLEKVPPRRKRRRGHLRGATLCEKELCARRKLGMVGMADG